MLKHKKVLTIICALGIAAAVSMGASAANNVSSESDSTLSSVSSAVTWETGSFSANSSTITKTDGNSSIRTVASFPKEQALIEVKDGYSFKINEVVAGSDGSYQVNRKYYEKFRVPYGEWIETGYFNVYTDRLYTIEVKKNDGSAISSADAENCVSIYKVDTANHVPEYYKKHIADKTKSINNLQKAPDAFSFIFITDVHIQHNAKHSIPLIKHLINNCGINDVLGGGDWVTAWLGDADGKQGLKDDYDELTELFEGIPLIKTVGNHDWAWGSDNRFNLTEEEIYDWYFKDDIEKSGAVKNNNGDPTTYFYKDDTQNKMRYICLNDMDYEIETNADGSVKGNSKTFYYTLSDEQIAWFKDEALRMPDDEWTCVVFSHLASYNQDEAGYNCDVVKLRDKVREVVEGFKDKKGDFADYKGDFVAWLSGHAHTDDMIYYSNNGKFVQIVSDGDTTMSSEKGRNRDLNTVNEQSFQVFTVDKNKKRVYCTRIGSGEDRSFNY